MKNNIVIDAVEMLGDIIERALKNLWGDVKQEEEPKRARIESGRYQADDKTTKDVNEAWVSGKKKNIKSKIKGKK